MVFSHSCHYSGRINSGGTSEVLFWFLGSPPSPACLSALPKDSIIYWHTDMAKSLKHFISYLKYCERDSQGEYVNRANDTIYFSIFAHLYNCSIVIPCSAWLFTAFRLYGPFFLCHPNKPQPKVILIWMPRRAAVTLGVTSAYPDKLSGSNPWRQ